MPPTAMRASSQPPQPDPTRTTAHGTCTTSTRPREDITTTDKGREGGQHILVCCSVCHDRDRSRTVRFDPTFPETDGNPSRSSAITQAAAPLVAPAPPFNRRGNLCYSPLELGSDDLYVISCYANNEIVIEAGLQL